MRIDDSCQQIQTCSSTILNVHACHVAFLAAKMFQVRLVVGHIDGHSVVAPCYLNYVDGLTQPAQPAHGIVNTCTLYRIVLLFCPYINKQHKFWSFASL